MQIGKVVEGSGNCYQADGQGKVNGEGFAGLLELMMGLVSQSDVQGLPLANTAQLDGKEQGSAVAAPVGTQEDELNIQNIQTQNNSAESNSIVISPAFYNMGSIVQANIAADMQGATTLPPVAEAPVSETFMNNDGNHLSSQQILQVLEEIETMVNLSSSSSEGSATAQYKALNLEQGVMTSGPLRNDAELIAAPKQTSQGVFLQPSVEGDLPLQTSNGTHNTVPFPEQPENNPLLTATDVKEAMKQVMYNPITRPELLPQETDTVIGTVQGNVLTPVVESGDLAGTLGQEGLELEPRPRDINPASSTVQLTRASAEKGNLAENVLEQGLTPSLSNTRELQQAEPPQKKGMQMSPSQPAINPGAEIGVDTQPISEESSLSVEQWVEVADVGNQPPGDPSGREQKSDHSAKKEVLPQREGVSQEVKMQPVPESVHSSASKPVEHNNMSFLNREVAVTHLPDRLTEMIRAMTVQQNTGETTLKMRLKPEQLGEVTIKLIWSNGELTAQFITSSSLAKEALESSLPQLREMLAQQNIRLSEAAVFMGQQSGQWNQHSSQSQTWHTRGQAKYKGGYAGIQVNDELTSTGHLLNEDARVNIVV